MGKSEEYNIAYKGLSIGQHIFTFDIRDSFFEDHEDSDIKNISATAEVLFDIKSSHIALNFKIQGSVGLECDRCLDIYQEPIDIEQVIYIKFGEKYLEEDENLYILPEADNEIDLEPFINELIIVSLPMKRVHKEDSNGESECKIDIQSYISNSNEGAAIDPRWNELNKLKDGTS